jgi:integrase
VAVLKKGGSYVAQVYAGAVDGKKRYVSRSAKTLKEARDIEAELKVAVAQGRERPSTGRTLGDLLAAYLDHFEGSPSTAYGYGLLVKRLPEDLTKLRLRQVTAQKLDAYYKSLRKAGLSGRSIRNIHALLRAALGRGVRWGWIGTNAALSASPGPIRGNQGRVATLTEIEALMAAADPDLGFAIRLAAVTGARRSELCGLLWADVDFEAATLTIRRSVVDAGGRAVERETTKTHQVRTLPLDATTLALLRQRRGIGPVLGVNPRTLSNRLAVLCAAEGITGLGWHSFRHWTATTLLGSTDAKTVATRLGHANPNVTLSVYAHALEQRDRDAADLLGRALG